MNNTIYLRRANKLMIEQEQGEKQLPKSYLATALKNIGALGYTFSDELMQAVRTLSKEQFEALVAQVVADLRIMVGAHVDYKPMYPGFPAQVMEEDEVELYLNAILHYLSLVYPNHESVERVPLLDKVNLKVIGLGNKADFQTLIRQLIEAKGSISETDKADIDTVLEHVEPDEADALLPAEIPFKENVGFVVASLLKHEKAHMDRIGPYFRTATDVLRLAVAWSGGDVSLALASPFRKFKRRERRLLLGLLEQCGSITEDMLSIQGSLDSSG